MAVLELGSSVDGNFRGHTKGVFTPKPPVLSTLKNTTNLLPSNLLFIPVDKILDLPVVPQCGLINNMPPLQGSVNPHCSLIGAKWLF